MALPFLYLAFRALLSALVRSRRGLDVKDIELLVLRLELLRRQVARPKLRAAARALLAARPASCHAPCAAASVWSPRARCCAGIGRSCAGNGAATSSASYVSLSTTTTRRGRTARSNSSHRNLGSHRRQPPSARSSAMTASAASSTSTTETPPEVQHDYWRLSR
jgi:hypothetical protein